MARFELAWVLIPFAGLLACSSDPSASIVGTWTAADPPTDQFQPHQSTYKEDGSYINVGANGATTVGEWEFDDSTLVIRVPGCGCYLEQLRVLYNVTTDSLTWTFAEGAKYRYKRAE
jgi:hypothetical protein